MDNQPNNKNNKENNWTTAMARNVPVSIFIVCIGIIVAIFAVFKLCFEYSTIWWIWLGVSLGVSLVFFLFWKFQGGKLISKFVDKADAELVKKHIAQKNKNIENKVNDYEKPSNFTNNSEYQDVIILNEKNIHEEKKQKDDSDVDSQKSKRHYKVLKDNEK